MSKFGLLSSVALSCSLSISLPAQNASPRNDIGVMAAQVLPQTKPAPPPHRFWDQQNAWLFAGIGAVRMLDYVSTRHFRNQGNDEWLLTNSIVDNKPLFVGIELAGTAASIGISYLFHRTGHHSAERWVSIIHIGVGTAGSIRNYTLKPPAAQP